MNERVNQLAREAGLIAPYGSDREGLRDFDYRMFAKLIVKECARILFDESEKLIELSSTEANPKLAEAYESCHYQCIDDIAIIETHFGVEE
jgi:hypothetical protein